MTIDLRLLRLRQDLPWLLRDHTPSVTKAVEIRAMTDDPEAWDDDGDYVGIERECSCGVQLSGYYEYIDHLLAEVGAKFGLAFKARVRMANDWLDAPEPAALRDGNEDPHIWEYIPTTDKLMEHVVSNSGDHTACDKPTWSPETDPRFDPEGKVSEDIWFSEHERDEADIVLCPICFTASEGNVPIGDAGT